jgi:hypothetical protein
MIKQMTVVATLCVLVLGACVSAGLPAKEPAQGAPGNGQVDGCGDRMEISATLTCPIPGLADEKVATASVYLAAPGFDRIEDCDLNELGPICRTLIMTRITCTWENMKLGDQELTESLWHGQGYREGAIAIAEEGYDSGLLPSGDRYLSRWSEFQLPDKTIAVWTPVFGTGNLAGITGKAVIECPPAPKGSPTETCSVKGCYSLPSSD